MACETIPRSRWWRLMGEQRTVECHHDDCDSSVQIPDTIAGNSAVSVEPDSWEITLQYNGTTLVIERAYCPEHTVNEMLDDVADSVRSFTNSYTKTMQVADELVDT